MSTHCLADAIKLLGLETKSQDLSKTCHQVGVSVLCLLVALIMFYGLLL